MISTTAGKRLNHQQLPVAPLTPPVRHAGNRFPVPPGWTGRLFRIALLLILIAGRPAGADGEKDNHPDKVRRIPRLGIEVPEKDRQELESGLSRLKATLDRLKASGSALVRHHLPDVEIFYRAVRDNLDYQEFFSPADIRKAKSLLTTGWERGRSLEEGKAPWLHQTGLVVRGFRSRLDDTVQPYGLVIPANYQPGGEKDFRLDIWFHGRGETLSETSFIDQRQKKAGYYQPDNTIVLHPYGRYSNAFKFAGEVDVLEALAHVRQEYRIDAQRISVRGFSMGGAACWQFAFLYSDRWFAANPGAGFAETPEFLKSFQKETLQPYPWEKKLWRWYDADDSAINFFHVPTIAYSGENDVQKQAADLMAGALREEGMELTHVIGPQTGHRIHPDSQQEIESRMSRLALRGNDRFPRVVHKVTHTLKYNRQYWLTITSLVEHWEPGRVRAEILDNSIVIRSTGITGLAIRVPPGEAPFEIGKAVKVILNGQTVSGPLVASDRSWSIDLSLQQGHWVAGKPAPGPMRKTHGLQGPIDDALMSSFLMVAPSGKPIHPEIGKWTEREMKHAITHWRQHFRGHARVKKDSEVSQEDLANHNLILWGDYRSNQLIRKTLSALPLRWNPESVSIGDRTFRSDRHVPLMIYPNPLNPRKYIVLNSSFTYREYAYLNNARQVPMLPDWAILDVVSRPQRNDAITRFAGIPVAADFFDEQWKVKK
ncbi:MAG: prolyl oligopeptidase family serine peptidase [Planctomycetota bacterium]|nr:prolyl oligopeptidase family serine peptidase [Planctomycetota bacterium]